MRRANLALRQFCPSTWLAIRRLNGVHYDKAFIQTRSLSSLPPFTVLNMPALSPTMQQGNLVKWHVKVGDELKPGTVLADVETDKATLAFENQDEGFVAKLLVQDGTNDIQVGKPLAVIVEEEEHVSAFASYSPFKAGSPTAPSEPPKTSKPEQETLKAATYPPHTRLDMPALSPTMERGNLVAWKVREGDAVRAGDVLAEIETDKATLAFETQEDGVIAKILVPAGTKDVPIGTLLAVTVDDKGDVPAFANYTPFPAKIAKDAPTKSTSAALSSSPGVQTSAKSPASASPPVPPKKASSRIGPAARLLMKAAGLSPDDIPNPTGPHNIITKGDVLAVIEQIKSGARPKPTSSPVSNPDPSASAVSPASASVASATPKTPPAAPVSPRVPLPPSPPSASYTDVPNSQIRKVIASRLLASKRDIPSLYASVDADISTLLVARAQLASQGSKASINDFVLKAVAAALAEVPEANVFWDETRGASAPFASVDVSVAVNTERGLITPVVRDAAGKSLTQIGAEVRALAAKARDGKLRPEEFQGGSFTVSNLGMFELSHFSAIINPPQSAILAVGGRVNKVVMGTGGKLESRDFITLTLSVDHRVFDGELIAKLLSAISAKMSSPVSLLL